MRRFLIATLFCVTTVATAGTTCAAGFDAKQKAELDRISAALNAIHSMTGRFVQIDPNGGLEEGKFYIEKPGRMRFEYTPPTPTLIVSDGTTVAVKNTKLDTVDRYPLISTPLDIVLSDKLDLKADKAVTDITHDGNSIIVKAKSTDKNVQGAITLVFSDPGLELRQWTVVDAQGLATTVALQDVEKGASLPAALFVMKDRNPFTKNQDE